ncbi:MAG: molecular chaperone HtpG [Alphaproteobacteria bacterium]|nr:molecular chaperone HtpG [Rickettsiales bacterium]
MSKREENFQFNAQTDKVLQMVVNSIYTKKEVFLRELLSNSMDAIRKRKYLVVTESDLFAPENGEYEITIEINKDARTISIIDNGIGMTKDELISNLGTIAKSGTEEFIKNLDKKNDLIGQFGVGFYSAFIVGSKVKVITKKVGSDKGFIWESNGMSDYTIKECFDPCKEGTTVIVELQKDADEFLDKFKLKFIVETYSSSCQIPIKIKSGSDIEVIKNKPPIWSRDKSTISEEDYKVLYKSLSHLPDKPLITIQYNGEGTLEFRSILFVPSMQPFNLFHPDRQTRVKLYSKNVFITEEQVQILPKHLRFIYGVLEFNDVPLNISRETIQAHHGVQKIENILVKKIYSELQNCLNNSSEDYAIFWKNFGGVMKEGLCENSTDKITILDNCLFYTTKNTDKPILLSEFISRLGDSKDILYCVGDSIENVMSNPQLEVFTSNDTEVLLLVDAVDSFWINVVHSYKEYSFKSVSKYNTEAAKPNCDSDSDDKDVNKDEIVTLFSKALKGKIKSVEISNKLVQSPACVSVSDGSMDIAMERLLLEQNQIKAPSLKILEINPNNNLVRHAVKCLREDSTFDIGKDWANLIFETTCIAQGESVKNTGAFAIRLNKLLDGLV